MTNFDQHYKELEISYYRGLEKPVRTAYQQKRLDCIVEITSKPKERVDFYESTIHDEDFVYEVEFLEFDTIPELNIRDRYEGTAVLIQENLGDFLEEYKDYITITYIGRGIDYFKTL